jgi:hypothetical protein
VNDQEIMLMNGGVPALPAVETVPSKTVNREELVKVSKVLKVLANADALTIFTLAKDGVGGDTFAYQKVGLTRKQYYIRLMQLKRAGLVEKKEHLYFQTTMGSFVYENCIGAASHAVRNSRKMVMVDVLKKEKKFTEEELLQMKMSVCSFKTA